MSVEEVFRRITAALAETGIAYMLTGSFASAYYGAPRSTQDIDLIIEASADQLHAFVNALPRNRYYVNGEAALDAQRRESMFNVIDMETGWKIVFIISQIESVQPGGVPSTYACPVAGHWVVFGES